MSILKLCIKVWGQQDPSEELELKDFKNKLAVSTHTFRILTSYEIGQKLVRNKP